VYTYEGKSLRGIWNLFGLMWLQNGSQIPTYLWASGWRAPQFGLSATSVATFENCFELATGQQCQFVNFHQLSLSTLFQRSRLHAANIMSQLGRNSDNHLIQHQSSTIPIRFYNDSNLRVPDDLIWFLAGPHPQPCIKGNARIAKK
jgi:hypothetical protein